MIFSGSTNVGMRRNKNEDSMAARQYTERTALFIVCDGMGGSKGGDIASKIAVETFVHTIDQFILQNQSKNRNVGVNDIKRALARGVDLANEKVYLYAKKNPEYKGMGTTLVAAMVFGTNVFAVNVGDSPLFALHGSSMKKMTKDHSYVQYLIDNGQLTQEQAEVSSQKNIITKAVGTEIHVEPYMYQFKLGEGSFLLLCSDGLTNMVDNATICDIVSNDRNSMNLDQVALDLKVRRLIDTANQNGGYDNITAILARL